MVGKFEPRRLTDFIDGEACETDVSQLKICNFFTYCPKCKSTHIIFRGGRNNKRKGKVRIYFCKNCRHKFTEETMGHFPLQVVEHVLSLTVKGLTPGDVVCEIMRISPYKITRQTVMNIIKRFVDKALKFELSMRHKLESKVWQIDDTPEIFPKNEGVDTTECKRSKCVWITNVLAVDTRYWLAAHVSRGRDAEESYKAIMLACKRAKYMPLKIRCDAYEGHRVGVHRAFRHIVVDWKSKREDFGYVNLIESLHSFLRRRGIKKRGRFRSVENLQYFIELLRIYYNFLHSHNALGTTPASKVGIAPQFKSWGVFIRYIFQLLR